MSKLPMDELKIQGDEEVHILYIHHDVNDTTNCVKCSQKMIRTFPEEHEEKCLSNQLQCKYCGGLFYYKYINLHMSTCNHNLTGCKYCKSPIQTSLLKSHKEECDFKYVECLTCHKKTVSTKKHICFVGVED